MPGKALGSRIISKSPAAAANELQALLQQAAAAAAAAPTLLQQLPAAVRQLQQRAAQREREERERERGTGGPAKAGGQESSADTGVLGGGEWEGGAPAHLEPSASQADWRGAHGGRDLECEEGEGGVDGGEGGEGEGGGINRQELEQVLKRAFGPAGETYARHFSPLFFLFF
jgi:hypothetical protein